MLPLEETEPEHYLWFIGCALGRIQCERAASIEELCERSDELLVLGSRRSQRARYARRAAKAAGVDFKWRTKPPKERLIIRRRKTIGMPRN